MNMNETEFFTKLDQPAPSWITFVCMTLASIAYVFLNIWSINMVAQGILAVGLYPRNLSEGWVTCFSACLQIIVGLFGLTTPLFFRRWTTSFLWPVLLVFVLTVMIFEGYHTVFSQMKNVIGSSLLKKETSDINSLNQTLEHTSSILTNTYLSKVQSYEELAERARLGKDKSGIATCGSICESNLEKLSAAKGRFSHLGLTAIATSSATEDVIAMSNELAQRASSLSAASADLKRFFDEVDQSAPPVMIAHQVEQIQNQVQAKLDRYKGMASLDSSSLAMIETNTAFGALFQGQLPRVEARLPLVYGVLPILGVLVLSVYIRVLLNDIGQYYGLGNLAADLAKESIAKNMWRKLHSLRSHNFVESLRAKYKRWDTMQNQP